MGNKNKLIGGLFLIALLVIVGYIIPITLTLGNQEIANPEIAFQIDLFEAFIGLGLIAIFGMFFGLYLWKKDNKFTESFGFFNIGESIPYFKRFTPLQLTLYSLIIFPTLFLISNFLNVGGLTGSKVLPQQFSPTESLAFSTLLIPTGEEILSLAVTGILVLGLIFIFIRYNLKKESFPIYYFGAIPTIKGILAVVWHQSAYAGSDIAIPIIFTFWFVKEIIILGTGFIIPGLILHMSNNFFIDFGRLYSDNLLLGFTVFIISISILLTYMLYKGRILGKKNDT